MGSIYKELRRQYPRTWRIWYRMNRRCEMNEQSYEDVEVCDQWNRRVSGEQGFIQFLDDLGPSEGSKELCRIDMRYDYTPGNTEWVSNRKIVNKRKRFWHTEQGRLLEEVEKHGVKQPSYFVMYWKQRGADIEERLKLFKPRNRGFKR